MLKQLLQYAGLESFEADVYLTCLKLGTQTLEYIYSEIGRSRKEVASTLEKLQDKGFVSTYKSGKVFYQPVQPAIILKKLESDKALLDDGIKNFRKGLKAFEDFANPLIDPPQTSFYRGEEGIKTVYEDTLMSKGEILAITSIDQTENLMPHYILPYYKRRRAAGIPIRAIFPDSEKSRQRHKRDKEEMRESRLLPKEILHIDIEVNIYNNKIAYFSLPEQLAIVIESRMIADSMRSIFNLCWEMAALYQTAPDPLHQRRSKTPASH